MVEQRSPKPRAEGSSPSAPATASEQSLLCSDAFFAFGFKRHHPPASLLLLSKSRPFHWVVSLFFAAFCRCYFASSICLFCRRYGGIAFLPLAGSRACRAYSAGYYTHFFFRAKKETGVPKEKGSGASAPAPPNATRALVCHGRIILTTPYYTKTQTEQSVCVFERRRSGMSALLP